MPVNEPPLRVCNKIDWLYDQTYSHRGEHTVRVNIKCVNASWAARSSAFVVHAFPAGVGEFVRVDEGVVARLTNVAVPEAVLLFLPQLDLSSTPLLRERSTSPDDRWTPRDDAVEDYYYSQRQCWQT